MSEWFLSNNLVENVKLYNSLYIFPFVASIIHSRCTYRQLVNQVFTKWKIALLSNPRRWSRHSFPIFDAILLFFSFPFPHCSTHFRALPIFHYCIFFLLPFVQTLSRIVSSPFLSSLFLFLILILSSFLRHPFRNLSRCTFHFTLLFSLLFLVLSLRTTFYLYCSLWAMKRT